MRADLTASSNATLRVNMCQFVNNRAKQVSLWQQNLSSVVCKQRQKYMHVCSRHNTAHSTQMHCWLPLAAQLLSGIWVLQRGGGVYAFRVKSVTINDSTFSANAALERGGGVYFYDVHSVTINGSSFSQNSAEVAMHGRDVAEHA